MPRFTSHGDVCYAKPGTSLKHGHWGDAARWFPGGVTQAAPAAGCGCGVPAEVGPASLEEWFSSAAKGPSDFHEHMEALRDLAATVTHATEVSSWFKPADLALAHAGAFAAVCASEKPGWHHLRRLLGDRFTSRPSGVAPTDLLFLDTGHNATVLFPQLLEWREAVSSYIVIHCTETYGEAGDDGSAGVIHALREFCKRYPEWVVKSKVTNNHGLLVLSRLDEDVKEKPALWRQAISFAKAKAKHLAAGLPMVDDETLAVRQNECSLCEYRALDACSACGCPLESKIPMKGEQCPKGKW